MASLLKGVKMNIYLISVKETWADGTVTSHPVVGYENHKDAAAERDKLNANARTQKLGGDPHYVIQPVAYFPRSIGKPNEND